MNWRDHLTQSEIDELAQIERAKKAGQAQARRIYDRCRKRMAQTANGKTAKDKGKPDAQQVEKA